MNFKNLLADDDAVSPVIGVILMVAITVILAAVIGTFVLGLGDQVQTTAPNSNFAFDFNNDNVELEVEHSGGDGIEAEELYLAGDVEWNNDTDSDLSWSNAFGDNNTNSGTIRAGDSAKVLHSANASDDNDYVFTGDGHSDEVSVVWRGADDRSSTLRTWSGPDA